MAHARSPSDIDRRLREMLDHYEIRKVLARYCQGCDRLDRARMASVYEEDSWDDHGPYKSSGHEFTATITDALARNSYMCSHQLGQSSVNVSGDEAGAETYFIASLRRPSDDGGEVLHQMGGRYVDTLQRQDGEWKIKRRICVRDWSIDHLLKSDWLRDSNFVNGMRSEEDPAYAALRISHSGAPASKTSGDIG
jgi:hypothetical protein